MSSVRPNYVPAIILNDNTKKLLAEYQTRVRNLLATDELDLKLATDELDLKKVEAYEPILSKLKTLGSQYEKIESEFLAMSKLTQDNINQVKIISDSINAYYTMRDEQQPNSAAINTLVKDMVQVHLSKFVLLANTLNTTQFPEMKPFEAEIKALSGKLKKMPTVNTDLASKYRKVCLEIVGFYETSTKEINLCLDGVEKICKELVALRKSLWARVDEVVDDASKNFPTEANTQSKQTSLHSSKGTHSLGMHQPAKALGNKKSEPTKCCVIL